MKASILYLGQKHDTLSLPIPFKLIKAFDAKEAKREFLGNLLDGLIVETPLIRASGRSFLRAVYGDYRYEKPAFILDVQARTTNKIQPLLGIRLSNATLEPSIEGWLLANYKKSSLKLQEGVRPLWASPRMESVIANIQKVARLDLNVLFLGETGVGKDHLARFLHHLSLRRDGPFVTIDCCAIPESLFEAELFGHKRGAYTSANEPRKGRIEQAQGGTCFLNEIGELPLNIQAKLLGVIERKRIVRLGDNEEVPLDVRFVFATNRDLEGLVKTKAFREDLFWRICGVTLEIPPLRKRVAEVPLLAGHFLRYFSQKFERPVPTLSSAAQELLMAYGWPGNVRELMRTIEKLCAFGPMEIVQAGMLQDLVPRLQKWKKFSLQKTTQGDIYEALKACNGNRRAAALRLGISERTVYRYLNLFGE